MLLRRRQWAANGYTCGAGWLWRGVRQKAASVEFNHSTLNFLDNQVNVCVAVCHRKEAVAPFPHIQTLIYQVVIEHVQIARKNKAEQRAKIGDLQRHLSGGKPVVKALRKGGSAAIEVILQSTALAFDFLQHGFCRRHCQRVFGESTSEKGSICLRIRAIAILPEAAVNAVHELGFAGDNANRHPAANDFAVSSEVCLYAKPGLCATWMNAKTCDHFVPNQDDAGFQGQGTQLV